MSTRAFVGVAVLAAVLLGGVATIAQTPRSQAARPGDTLQLWEYRTEIARERGVPAETRGESRRGNATATDAMLNGWGREGWELVAVTRREVRVDDTMQTETAFTFKRPTGSTSR